jgi:hypothetical protein
MVATLQTDSAPGDPARANCFRSTTIADSAPMSPQHLAQNSDAIVIGTLASIGPGFWDSPDGRRPLSYRRMSDARLLTALNIVVERTLKGSAHEGAVKPGGTNGCHTSNHSPELELNEGGRYVFFLFDVPWSRPGASGLLVPRHGRS